MATIRKAKTLGRELLKKYFKHGEIPTENHFSSLIDSMLNKQDDGFSKDDRNGFILSASPEAGRFITLYETMDDQAPFFVLEKDNHESGGVKLTPGNPEGLGDSQQGSIYFHTNGNLGIGKRSLGEHRVEVQGFAGMDGRAGTYRKGSVPANGKWHSIVKRLDNCQAFEIVARTGTKSSGKFAIVHAIAMRALGKSHGRIRRTGAHYGFFWNKIKLRWHVLDNHQYELQIKTNSNYGPDVNVYYHVCKLWDDEIFLPEEYYF